MRRRGAHFEASNRGCKFAYDVITQSERDGVVVVDLPNAAVGIPLGAGLLHPFTSCDVAIGDTQRDRPVGWHRRPRRGALACHDKRFHSPREYVVVSRRWRRDATRGASAQARDSSHNHPPPRRPYAERYHDGCAQCRIEQRPPRGREDNPLGFRPQAARASAGRRWLRRPGARARAGEGRFDQNRCWSRNRRSSATRPRGLSPWTV